jgi:hypothetical protein
MCGTGGNTRMVSNIKRDGGIMAQSGCSCNGTKQRGSQFQGKLGLSQPRTHTLPQTTDGAREQAARGKERLQHHPATWPHSPGCRVRRRENSSGSENSVCDRASCLRQGWIGGAMPNNAVPPPICPHLCHPASGCPTGRHLHRRCCCQMDTLQQ